MKADEFDRRFDNDEDIIEALDPLSSRRPESLHPPAYQAPGGGSSPASKRPTTAGIALCGSP